MENFFINYQSEEFYNPTFNPDYSRSIGNEWDFEFRESLTTSVRIDRKLLLNLRRNCPK